MPDKEETITTVPIHPNASVAERVAQAVPMEDLFHLVAGTGLNDRDYPTEPDLTKMNITEYIVRTGWGDITRTANSTDRERRKRAKALRRAQKIQTHGKHLHIYTTWELFWVGVMLAFLCVIFSGAMVAVWLYVLSLVGVL
jgi:hypothetical protein